MLKLVGLVVIFSLAVGYAFASGPGHATDWAAVRAWTVGLPHDMGVWNPCWAKLILLAFAVLPQDVGRAWLNVITFAAVISASNQLGAFLPFLVYLPAVDQRLQADPVIAAQNSPSQQIVAALSRPTRAVQC